MTQGVGVRTLAITGASGFLGSAILSLAAKRGVPVRALVRRPMQQSFPSLVRPIVCDITDRNSLRGALDGVDCVIHTAGLAHVFASRPPETEYQRINVDGAVALADAAVAARVPHLVLISSIAV